MFDIKQFEELSGEPARKQREFESLLKQAASIVGPIAGDRRLFFEKLQRIAPDGPKDADGNDCLTPEQDAACAQAVICVTWAQGMRDGLMAAAGLMEDPEAAFVDHLQSTMTVAKAWLQEAQVLKARWEALGTRPN